MTTQTHDILIAGGGVPGLTLAALLAPLGLRIAVVDPAPYSTIDDVKADSRTTALMQGSLRILDAAGVGAAARERGAELRILRIVDENSMRRKAIEADFHASDIGLEAFAVNIPNTPLRALLCDHLRTQNNVTLLQTKLDSYDAQAAHVHARLADGTAINAPLLVGADGRRSPVRAQADLPVREHDFGQSAITCLIRHSRAHDYISTEYHRPTGPFTLVPLPGKMSSVVWVDDRDAAESFMAINRRAFTQALQDRTREALGTVTLEEGPSCFPLIGLKAARLTAPRCALMAEAAHVLHPLGAQGLNLSLRDAAALAEIIADAARLGLDIGSGSVLSGYERKRAADIGSRVYGTEGLNKLVSNNRAAIHALRRGGLRLVNNIGPLKILTMQQGLAPQDPHSRLVRGEAL